MTYSAYATYVDRLLTVSPPGKTSFVALPALELLQWKNPNQFLPALLFTYGT